MENKKHIRKEVLALRDTMTQEEWQEKSRQILQNILQQPAYRQAKYILCYVNYKKEVETTELICESLKRGKKVYCPVVCKSGAASAQENTQAPAMEFYGITSLAQLQPGFRGIREPAAEASRLYTAEGRAAETLMIMPGAVFDRAHHRIGYGGGYYDRYLEKAPGIETMALAFSFQVRGQIPYEPHDVRPRSIITEDGIL